MDLKGYGTGDAMLVDRRALKTVVVHPWMNGKFCNKWNIPNVYKLVHFHNLGIVVDVRCTRSVLVTC